MTQRIGPGWYPDPSGGPATRWWDGQAWDATAVGAAPVPLAYTAPAAAPPAYHYPEQHPTPPHTAPASRGSTSTLAHQSARRPARRGNRYAYITFAVVAAYVAIAFESSFVVLGLLPLAMALRSKRNREPLAALAFIAAVASIVFAVVRLTQH